MDNFLESASKLAKSLHLFLFVYFSEATQSVIIYSRQGTTDTIEEVEDEQDQGEDKEQVPWESQAFKESQEVEGEPWSNDERRQIEGEGEYDGQMGLDAEEDLQGAGEPKDKENEEGPWESFSPDEGPSMRLEEAESVPAAQENDFITESEDGEGLQDSKHTDSQAGLLYTPDTDASKTSDAEVPPSYSKAVSFDRLEVSDDESDSYRKRRMVMTSDSRSDSRSDIMLPSMTTELTASELLLNK